MEPSTFYPMIWRKITPYFWKFSVKVRNEGDQDAGRTWKSSRSRVGTGELSIHYGRYRGGDCQYLPVINSNVHVPAKLPGIQIQIHLRTSSLRPVTLTAECAFHRISTVLSELPGAGDGPSHLFFKYHRIFRLPDPDLGDSGLIW